MKSIDVFCSGAPSYKRALMQWARVNARLVGVWKHRDLLPWMGNERTNVSLLSAAVWSLRGIALEEVPDTKTKPSATTGGHSSKGHGRIDLLFDLGQERYAVESKAARLTITDSRGMPFAQLAKRFEGARKDAKRTPARGRILLAILFVHIRLEPVFHRQVSDRLETLVKGLKERQRLIKFDAAAWSFPKAARAHADSKRGYIHPGTLVLVGEIRR